MEFTVGGARTVDEAAEMAALGATRLVVAVRAKEVSAVQDELARFGETVIAATRDL
jgi:hypothetical protein